MDIYPNKALECNSMRIYRIAVSIITLFFMFALAASALAAGRHVDVLRLKADINPVTASYVERGIAAANSDGAAAVVIELDTPGGDLASMTDIIEHMEASRVPTIVYVYPAGAWAGSAGTFITVAADVAAMAPDTSIGAASPVGSGGSDLGKTEREKVTNFAAAYIQGLAKSHGHNATFAVQAVRSAKAIPYYQALSEHVINYITRDLPSLLKKADGYSTKTPNGTVVFHTAGAAIHYIDMDWSERLLLLLANPDLVLILMSIGTLAIIFELSSPGAILPGVVGVLCLAIAFFALGVIPINAAGLALIAFAILLFIADIKMPTHGILTVGGIISFALGALLLFSPASGSGGPSLSPWVVIFVTLLMAGFFGFVVRKAIRAQRAPVMTGIEGMVGTVGTARTDLNPSGMVYAEGSLWKAIADTGEIKQGEKVTITRVDGLTLHVAPVISSSPSATTASATEQPPKRDLRQAVSTEALAIPTEDGHDHTIDFQPVGSPAVEPVQGGKPKSS
jgi:membrane-bound serine protease (ClpP class)